MSMDLVFSESEPVSGGSFSVSVSANFIELSSSVTLGGGLAAWNAAPKVRGRFFELEHLSFL